MTSPKKNPTSLVKHNQTSDLTQTTQLNIRQHTLVIREGTQQSTIELYTPSDQKRIEIQLTDQGAIVKLNGNIAIDAEGSLDVTAEEIHLRAKKSLNLSTKGELNIEADGDMRSKADAHQISAKRGDVEIDANDNVIVSGERIRLN